MRSTRPQVLIYSKDPDFFLVFGHILSVAGFDAHLVQTKPDALRFAVTAQPIALVMDCQAGDRAAVGICEALRPTQTSRGTPVAALIAPKAGALHLDLIKAGAEERFSRPFAPDQLLAWLSAKASSARLSLETDTGDLTHGPFRLERRNHRVFFNKTEIAMPPIEFKLLRCLLAEPGAVFSREAMIAAAWPDHATDADLRNVDVHIARLRKRLRVTVGHDAIRTVRSAGYAFAPNW